MKRMSRLNLSAWITIMSMYCLPGGGVMNERLGFGYPFPFLYLSTHTVIHSGDILVSIGSCYIFNFITDVGIVYVLISGFIAIKKRRTQPATDNELR